MVNGPVSFTFAKKWNSESLGQGLNSIWFWFKNLQGGEEAVVRTSCLVFGVALFVNFNEKIYELRHLTLLTTKAKSL